MYICAWYIFGTSLVDTYTDPNKFPWNPLTVSSVVGSIPVIATRKNHLKKQHPAARHLKTSEDQGAPFFWAYFGYPHLRTISRQDIPPKEKCGYPKATNSKKRIPNVLFEHPLSCHEDRLKSVFLAIDMANHLKMTNFWRLNQMFGRFSKPQTFWANSQSLSFDHLWPKMISSWSPKIVQCLLWQAGQDDWDFCSKASLKSPRNWENEWKWYNRISHSRNHLYIKMALMLRKKNYNWKGPFFGDLW